MGALCDESPKSRGQMSSESFSGNPSLRVHSFTGAPIARIALVMQSSSAFIVGVSVGAEAAADIAEMVGDVLPWWLPLLTDERRNIPKRPWELGLRWAVLVLPPCDDVDDDDDDDDVVAEEEAGEEVEEEGVWIWKDELFFALTLSDVMDDVIAFFFPVSEIFWDFGDGSGGVEFPPPISEFFCDSEIFLLASTFSILIFLAYSGEFAIAICRASSSGIIRPFRLYSAWRVVNTRSKAGRRRGV